MIIPYLIVKGSGFCWRETTGMKLGLCYMKMYIGGREKNILFPSIVPTIILSYGSIFSTSYELSYNKYLFWLFCLLEISETLVFDL